MKLILNNKKFDITEISINYINKTIEYRESNGYVAHVESWANYTKEQAFNYYAKKVKDFLNC